MNTGQNHTLWEELRIRMQKSQQVLDVALNPGMESMAKHLRLRAGKLADPVEEVFELQNHHSLLLFACGGERFALRAEYCMGVAVNPELYKVPGVSQQILGLVSFQGISVPVFATGNEFDSDEESLTLLILGLASAEFGIVVDAAPELHRMEEGEFSSDSESYEKVFGGSVCGIDKDGRMLLDGELLLTSELYGCSKE
jgi:chemotaxis signal transduction protein